jgi:DNA end-binding protein Ku
MSQRGVQGVAQVVLARREQLVLLWPLERILCMTVLKYAAQVRSPAGYWEELADCEAAEEERALATTLVDQTTCREFDLARYKDEYAEKLTQVIDAAVHGKELVAAPSDEPRQVLNLLDALKASVAQGDSPAENGGAHNALAKQLARPRSGRTAAVKNGTAATQKTIKKPASRRRRKKSA